MAYGVLASLALTASALGLALALGLFRLIGPKRTKTVGQVLGALIGAGFFITSQIRNMVGGGRAASLWSEAVSAAVAGGLRLPEPATWPAQRPGGQGED